MLGLALLSAAIIIVALVGRDNPPSEAEWKQLTADVTHDRGVLLVINTTDFDWRNVVFELNDEDYDYFRTTLASGEQVNIPVREFTRKDDAGGYESFDWKNERMFRFRMKAYVDDADGNTIMGYGTINWTDPGVQPP